MKIRLRYMALITALSVMILTSCSNENAMQKEYAKDIFAMDTFMTVKAYGDNAEAALDEAETEIKRIEALFSVTDPQSDISKINKNGGQPVEVSEDTFELISKSLDFCRETDGALDITVYPVVREWGFTTGSYNIPDRKKLSELLKNTGYKRVSLSDDSVLLEKGMELDLGSVAKGYCSGRIADIMKQKGVSSALINLGGNVQAIGTKPDGTAWRVGIQDPDNSEEIACTLSVSDCAVVTSGNYERFFVGEDGKKYCHIIDPKTGCPADNGIISASIIGKSGLMCDAYSTALFVMGTDKAIEFCRSHQDFEAVFITDSGMLYITEGLENDSDISDRYKVSIIKR